MQALSTWRAKKCNTISYETFNKKNLLKLFRKKKTDSVLWYFFKYKECFDKTALSKHLQKAFNKLVLLKVFRKMYVLPNCKNKNVYYYCYNCTLNRCKCPILPSNAVSICVISLFNFSFSFLRCRSISSRVVYCLVNDLSLTRKTVIFLLFSASHFFVSSGSSSSALSRFCKNTFFFNKNLVQKYGRIQIHWCWQVSLVETHFLS